MKKSYNPMALRGLPFSDLDLQKSMADTGLNIPDHLLFTPGLNDFVLAAEAERAVQARLEPGVINQNTGAPFTYEEAVADQRRYTDKARRNIQELLSAQ